MSRVEDVDGAGAQQHMVIPGVGRRHCMCKVYVPLRLDRVSFDCVSEDRD